MASSLHMSIKDLRTHMVKLRCDSQGDLYPLRLSQHQALTASSPASAELWHNRLGHPGSNSFRQVLSSFDFQCNKSATHTCSHCQLGKHVRLPFYSSETPVYFPFQLVHSDVWTSPVYSHSGFKYMLFCLMLTPITFGLSRLDRNLTFRPSSALSSPTYTHNSDSPFLRSKQTMGRNLTTSRCVISSLHKALPSVSLALTPHNKMARPRGLYA